MNAVDAFDAYLKAVKGFPPRGAFDQAFLEQHAVSASCHLKFYAVDVERRGDKWSVCHCIVPLVCFDDLYLSHTIGRVKRLNTLFFVVIYASGFSLAIRTPNA